MNVEIIGKKSKKETINTYIEYKHFYAIMSLTMLTRWKKHLQKI